jgi:hypothetical protein
MSRERACPEPLEIDFSREPIVRQYEVVFNMALRDDYGQIRTHEEYLARMFGYELGAYIVYHAITDASDIVNIPEIENDWHS